MTRFVGLKALHAGALLSAFAAAGCFDVESIDPGAPPRATTALLPDSSGFIAPGSNPVGITGFWFSYGDQYDEPRRCTVNGKHPPDVGAHAEDECSYVAWPTALPELSFPNLEGSLCTYGNVAKVNRCKPGVECAEDLDYSNMWGSGIGLDFALPLAGDDPPTREPYERATWDALAHGIAGVAFDFTWIDTSVVENPAVRVEFPVELPASGRVLAVDTVGLDGQIYEAGETLPEGASSEEHPSGSPFVHAPKDWTGDDVSGVVNGHNEVLWSDVNVPPGATYAFDPSRLFGIQFHVPTVKDRRVPYAFCVEHVVLLQR